MSQQTDLKPRIKVMIVDNLMLQVRPDEIADDAPLFGPTGLGLDSVDALQLVVSLEKNFALKISDTSEAKKILQSVNTIAAKLVQMEDANQTSQHQPPKP